MIDGCFDIKKAGLTDIALIMEFVDWWLTGKGKSFGIPGATHECFISPSQHMRYVEKYDVRLLYFEDHLVGWSVVDTKGQLIHFLIAGTFRGIGLGSAFLQEIQPQTIRSKSDQQTGNPEEFYKKNGYVYSHSVQPRCRFRFFYEKPQKKKTIDIFEKKNRRRRQ